MLRRGRGAQAGLHPHAHAGQRRPEPVVEVAEDAGPLGVALAGHVEPRVLGLDGEADRAGHQADRGQQLGDHPRLPRLQALGIARVDEQRADPVAADQRARAPTQPAGTSGSSPPSTIRASRVPLAVATIRAALSSRSRGSIRALRSAVITATSEGEITPLP